MTEHEDPHEPDWGDEDGLRWHERYDDFDTPNWTDVALWALLIVAAVVLAVYAVPALFEMSQTWGERP